MTKQKSITAKGTLLFPGYFFSIAGGLLGIPFALFILLGKYDKESKNHGGIMLLSALVSIASVIIFRVGYIVEHLSKILAVYILAASVIGAIIAFKKKDFISRGFSISLLTGIFGLAVMLFSPQSKAREGDKSDFHSWPELRGLAPILFIGLLIFLLIISQFGK